MRFDAFICVCVWVSVYALNEHKDSGKGLKFSLDLVVKNDGGSGDGDDESFACKKMDSKWGQREIRFIVTAVLYLLFRNT